LADSRPIQSTLFSGFARSSPGCSAALGAVIGQRLGDRSKHFPSMTHTMHRDSYQSACESRFDGPRRRGNEIIRRGLRVQANASAVLSIALTPEEAFSDESLEDPRDRTRVQMDDAREFSSRETRARSHDPKDEPLRTRNPESCLHPFRRALEPMLDAPQ
jgi:hypothetical protein